MIVPESLTQNPALAHLSESRLLSTAQRNKSLAWAEPFPDPVVFAAMDVRNKPPADSLRRKTPREDIRFAGRLNFRVNDWLRESRPYQKSTFVAFGTSES